MRFKGPVRACLAFVAVMAGGILPVRAQTTDPLGPDPAPPPAPLPATVDARGPASTAAAAPPAATTSPRPTPASAPEPLAIVRSESFDVAPFYVGVVGAGLFHPVVWRDNRSGTDPPASSSSLNNAAAGGARAGFFKAFVGDVGIGFGASASFWRGVVAPSTLPTAQVPNASYSVLGFDTDLHFIPVPAIPVSLYGLAGLGGAFFDGGTGAGDYHGGVAYDLGVGVRAGFLRNFAAFVEYRWAGVDSGHTVTTTMCTSGVCGDSDQKTWTEWFGTLAIGVTVAIPPRSAPR